MFIDIQKKKNHFFPEKTKHQRYGQTEQVSSLELLKLFIKTNSFDCWHQVCEELLWTELGPAAFIHAC